MVAVLEVGLACAVRNESPVSLMVRTLPMAGDRLVAARDRRSGWRKTVGEGRSLEGMLGQRAGCQRLQANGPAQF